MNDATDTSGQQPQGDSPVSRFKAEVDRAKDSVEEARTEFSSAIEQRRGGPIESVDEASARLEELRGSLTRDIATLRDRVPDPKDLSGETKRNGAIVAGSVVALGVGVVVLKRRGAKKAEHEELQRHAAAIAAEIVRLQRQPVEDEEADDADEGGGLGRRLLLLLGVALGIGGAWWQRSRSQAALPEVAWGPADLPEGVGPVEPGTPPPEPHPAPQEPTPPQGA